MTWPAIGAGEKAPNTWANKIQNALGDGYPSHSASYTVFKVGTTYYIRDGLDGTILSSGGVAETVIQAAYDALLAGQTLSIKGGKSGDTKLTLSTGLTFNTMHTKVVFEALHYDADITPITISGANITVEGNFMYRDTTPTTKEMISVTANNAKIFVNEIYAEDGVGVKIQNCYFTWLNCRYMLGVNTGAYLYATNGETTAHNTIIIGEVGPANKAGIAVKFEKNGTGRVARNTAFKTLFQAFPHNDDVGYWNNDENTLLDCHVSDLNANGEAVVNSGTLQIIGGDLDSKTKITNTGIIRLSQVAFNGVVSSSGNVWHINPVQALQDLNRNASMGAFTNLDLTATTSGFAHQAIVQIDLTPDAVGAGNYVYVQMRKKGSTGYSVDFLITKNEAIVGVPIRRQFIIGLDDDQLCEYIIILTAGWQIDTTIHVLGYCED